MIFMNRRPAWHGYHRPVFADPPPFRRHLLDVGHGHRIDVQESGQPSGQVALVLHGGPGSGCSPLLRRFFDPQRWRIVCVDQRGAGRSLPRGSTAHNTTADLLADLRAVRTQLGIAQWVVVGGSWGATLAIAHALDAPDAVAALLLRAVFLARATDIDAFFAAQPGLPALDWRGLAAADAPAQAVLARAWWQREQVLAGAPASMPPQGDALAALIDRYRVQSHYLQHACWLDNPPLLARASALPRVPTLLLHGACDRVCPPEAAQALQARLPHALLGLVPGVGHDPSHPAMAAAMVQALSRYAEHAAWPTQAVP